MSIELVKIIAVCKKNHIENLYNFLVKELKKLPNDNSISSYHSSNHSEQYTYSDIIKKHRDSFSLLNSYCNGLPS